MNDTEKEILRITQEECAEVIQAISKVFRFGLETEWNGVTNIDHLTEECGDVLAMIKLLGKHGLINRGDLDDYADRKIKKLEKWSHIFEK